MFKKLLTSILLIMSLTISSQVSTDNSIHQFKVADISGNIFDFSELILISTFLKTEGFFLGKRN